MLTSIRFRALGTTVVMGALLLSACSSQESEPAEPTSPGVYAMSGLDRPAGEEVLPVLTVKIENTRDGQVDVSAADLVTELPVEGGLTRLAAFYQSEKPTRVGPVRSARNSDIGLVQPANSVLVASGAAESTLQALEAAGIVMVLEDSPSITRDPSRPSSYNLFADLAEIGKAHSSQLPSQSYLDFGEFTESEGKPATSLQITFSGSSAETWTLDKTNSKWRRKSNGEYAADTMLVFEVEEEDAGYVDAAGSSVPIVVSTGTGKGSIVTGGQVFEITWSKAASDAPWAISNAAGQTMQVPPGNTWISLIPKTTGSFSFS